MCISNVYPACCYFIKNCVNFPRNSLGQLYILCTLGVICTSSLFYMLQLMFDNSKKTTENLGKIYHFFPRGPLGENWIFLQKCQKILHNVTLRAITIFYRKHTKLPKNFFGQNMSIFNLGNQFVYTTLFLSVTPVN